ncbi:MAG: hypothetical protein CMM93_06185 [Rickettsiales bacterium]|nr:hypothetical protein [Rickettsiales bacterium]|tara:strand:- start:861 stop:1160 length:300 start_codon:yes stop_codon:yes gene_type:complete
MAHTESHRAPVIRYFAGFLAAFALFIGGTWLVGSALVSESALPTAVLIVLPILIFAAIASLAALFLKKTAALSQDVHHDGSTIKLSKIAEPQKRPRLQE